MQKETIWFKRNWLLATGVNAVLFLLFFLIATPLLNSGDDAYLMYTLGGGFDGKPTALLQYNHIWHPVLSSLVSTLFSAAPGINWYTVLLIGLHFAGCSSLLYVLLKRSKPAIAVPAFLILFLFSETRQLLSLTFTGAAFTAAIGGVMLFTHQLQQQRVGHANTVAGVIMLLLAGLLRLQVAWLVILLMAAIAIVMLGKKQFLLWTVICIAVAAALWGLNKQHEQYYKKNIPAWEKQEKFRQALFYSYNRQVVNSIPAGVFTDSTEQSLFFSAFLYDTSRFTTERIAAISKGIVRNRSIFNKEDRAGLYWFFVELRVYLLLLAGLAVFAVVQKKATQLVKCIPIVLAWLAVHTFLFMFLKITMPIHLGLLLVLLLAVMLQLLPADQLLDKKNPVTVMPLLLIVVAAAWVCIRLSKENKMNKANAEQFLCAMKELNQNRDKLLVATDDALPISYFPVWHTPAQHPAANLLYKDRLITFTYPRTLQRFRINDLQQAMKDDGNLYFLGRKLTALETITGDSLVLTGPVNVLQCLQLWQLKKKQ